ncbi:hypothetical protein SERLADRAFT_355167 [Serpula lacrymans var. lacrymans S7.9]|uniref:Uncharacterized protein n=1 Tax=Serpula lacrymans var. lacrymans (strain S7.9) TaxID=578457 RepID=F8NR01_SERL9|nr:uncharacterized protein SERLADRAFT_355167 [Serpula lacrymans var. lacrymans S7.9]EGO26174.1 hypothetical protein SERLADRAFT_355167 [Serpula lacrymans var. lacrymans S7.9]
MSSTTTSATSASVPASATTAAATTPLATTTTKSGLMRGGDVYKGKYTNRSWQQLPPDIIRIIATHYLVDFTASTYIPHTWLTKEMWHNRVVYTVLRDANDLERLMRVSPAWKAALETHLFWYQACSIIDPHDTLAQHIHTNPLIPSHHSSHAPRQTPSPYRHFRTLTSTSCIVCLINAPPATYISTGLFLAKRTHPTPTLGVVTLCKDHRRAFFCGVCLREAPVSECEPETGPYAPIHPSLMVCCAENEDDETWPGVETTCRSCRTEFLWRRISGSERDREAIGGALWPPTFHSTDYQTRQTVDAFIELGEGSISEVLCVAREKLWLRKETKMVELMGQALAAARWEGGDDDDACSNFSDRSDTSDPDLLTLTEDLGGIRELAILDWARGRILDGWWCSPADEWYGYVSGKRGNDDDVEGDDGGWRTVRAVHPCPWSHQYRQTSMTASRSANHSPPSYCSPCLPSSQSHNRVIRPKLTHSHPLSRTIDAPTPPSFALCEQAYRAYQKQLRLILLPAMKNIVKRMVAEAGASENGRVDPATRAARMSMEEVLTELRTPGVWFDRVDWIDDGYSERGLRMDGKKNDEDVESSSTGTERSDGSHATSPVLSTTTLRTTPSPSPVREKEETFSSVAQKSTTSLTTSPSAKSTAGLNTKLTIVPIPISPVLESPSLLHPIPYVPLTSQGMPQYSMEAFKSVWREACAPLYSCRCAICERTLIKLQLAATFSGGVRPSEPVQVPVQSQNQLIYATHPQQRAVDVVRLEEQSPRRFFEEEEEEEEEEVYAEEEEESEEGDDLEFSSDEAENDAKTRAGRRDLRVVGDPGTIGKIYLSLPPQVHTRQTQQSVTPRKRSSGDLDGDHVDRDSGNGAQETNQSQKSGTPPKRPRREASDTNPVLAVTAPTPDNRGDAESKARSSQCSTPAEQVKSSTPTRQRKRSSEEIDTSGDNVSVGNGGNRESVDNAKRARVDNREMLKAGLVKGGELDGLYVFEAESGGVDMS